MSVNANLPYKEYTGNDSAPTYEFQRKVINSSDLKIINTVISTGATSNWTDGVDYTATGFGTNTITITPSVTLPSTEKILIYTDSDFLQENDYVDLDQFPADRFEDDLDKACLERQELRRLIDQCISAGPEGLALSNISVTNNTVLGFDSNGAVTNYTISGDNVTSLLQINAQTGTSYTLVIGDSGKVVEMNNASANTLTFPPNSSVAFPIGSRLDVTQMGAGLTTIAAGAGVTLRGDLVSRGQYHGLSAYKRAADEWVVIGGTTA